MLDREQEKLNLKLLGSSDSGLTIVYIFHHISMEVNVYSLWLNLKNLYERKMMQNKAFLICKLENMKYKEETSVAEHLSNFQNVMN